MKKLLVLALLFTTMVMNAQIKFVDEEYVTASVAIDPNATIKDGLNITPELELVSYWKYIKINSQIMPSLEGGYIDFTGTFGTNITSGYFNQWRGYTGVRLGHIRRGKYGYPLAGIEVGVEFKISSNVFIGVRTSFDNRSDFKYSGAIPKVINSNYIEISFKL